MWTRWASRYVMKEDQLGSLEEGKWADLLIIDRDYFTIPTDDILKIGPLMTMVGGDIKVPQRLVGKPMGNGARRNRRTTSRTARLSGSAKRSLQMG